MTSNDDITVELMIEACGVRYQDATDGMAIKVLEGAPIPFAGAELMLKMKQNGREKDSIDRRILQQLIRDRRNR